MNDKQKSADNHVICEKFTCFLSEDIIHLIRIQLNELILINEDSFA